MAIVESCDADAVSQAQLSHNIAIANASTQPTVSNSSYTKEGTALGSSDTSPNLPLDLLPPKSLSWIEQELRDTWNAEETRRKMREKEVLCEREEKSHEAILISYQKYATDEDKELVDGWNENLNILLTFAGLLSGIITAFILQAGIPLQPSPADTTNALLFNLVLHLDPSAHASPPSSDSSSTTLQVSAWWYASLSCSLLSAFGGLVSKQWIIRYRKMSGEDNSLAAQCNLRELRYGGLVEWRFFAIMEALPLLLQFSLLLFSVGLVQALWSQSRIVASVVIGSMILGGLFYILTLLCGILFVQCPFKSPVTDFMGTVGLTVLLGMVGLSVLVVGGFLGWVGLLFGNKGLWNTIKHWAKEMKWLPLIASSFTKNSTRALSARGSAGIYIWALRRADAKIDLLATEKFITVRNPQITRAPRFRTIELLHEWSSNAKRYPLSASTSSNTSFQLAGDALFRLLEQSPFFHNQIEAYFNVEELEMDIRRIWRVDSVNGLVLTDMRPATVSAYLYVVMSSLHDDRLLSSTRELLVSELAEWIQHLPRKSYRLFRAALEVSSWLLVPAGTLSEESIGAYEHAYLPPGESILFSLERLAKYQGNAELLPIVLGSPALGNFTKSIHASQRWKSGKTSQDVMTLIKRSHSWSSDALKESLLRWTELLAHEGNSTILSGFQTSDAVPLALATFKSTSTLNYATSSPNTDDLKKLKRRIQFLDVALGLHYFNIIPSKTRFRRATPPTITTISPEEHTFAILLNDPHVLKVMIDVLNDHRHALLPSILSILVKGRPLFLSQEAATKYSTLTSEFEGLLGKLVRSGRPWDWLGYEEGDFTQAEAAVSMLKELSRLVKVSVSGLREELRVSGGRGREVHCSIIEFYGVGRRDLMA